MKIPWWLIVIISIAVGYFLRAVTSPAQFIKGDSIIYKIDSSKKYFSYNNQATNAPKLTGSRVDTFYFTQPVDTAAILKAYFTKNFYRQSVRDSDLALSIFDTIGENKIEGRGIVYQLLKPQTIDHNIKVEDKATRSFSVGAMVSAPVDLSHLITSVNATGCYADKKGRKWIFFYDLVNKSAGAGLLIPIIGTR